MEISDKYAKALMILGVITLIVTGIYMLLSPEIANFQNI